MEHQPILCNIEHHAVLFALLCKHAMLLSGDEGKDAVLHGMTAYGNERGARMAANALANGEELTTMTNQAYGEWKPDFDGQMEFGILRIEPTLQTYISKCAWCEAWKKYDLLEYGKYYCVDVDHAVYQGFRSDFVCTPLTTALSFGGTQCQFDWAHPLTEDETKQLSAKKKALGASCMKDFNFHTSHLLHTVGNIIKNELGEHGDKAISQALAEYVHMFGQEYLDVLDSVDPLMF